MRTVCFRAGLVISILAIGCASRSDGHDDSSAEAIVAGTPATAYPEAVLIDMPDFGCSGALIAPQVVLTAGHCVPGVREFDVIAPYAGNQSAKSTSSEVFDFRDMGESVDGSVHDIALLYLKTPIHLDRYPKLSNAKLAVGARLVNIGRVKNNVLAHHNLYVSRPLVVSDASGEDFPFDYRSKEVIESGDSGGPCEIPDSPDHEIAAVNSASGDGEQVLARTDLLHAWIQKKIAAHGGGGFESGDGHEGEGDGGANPGQCQRSETEPNDSGDAANALGTDVADACGAIAAGGDRDWFTFSLAEAGVDYAIELTATGDAQLTVQKRIASGWKTLGSDGKRVANTSTSASAYRIGVQSPSGTAQTYTLHLTR